MAILFGLIFLVERSDTDTVRRGTVRIGAITDNRGNEGLVRKMMTTKFPLCAVLMEVASWCDRRGVELGAHWAPRLQNEEADALTNEMFHDFSPEHRVPVDLEAMESIVLDDLIASGLGFLDSKKEAKKALPQEVAQGTGGHEKALPQQVAQGKKRKKVPLRERDPW